MRRNKPGANMGRICSNCSLPMNADDAFCGSCGQPVPSSDATIGEVTARHQVPKPRGIEEPGRAAGGTSTPQHAHDADLEGGQGGTAQGVTLARWLDYRKVSSEPTYDPLANSRFLLQVARQAALFAGLYILADIVVGIVCLLLGAIGLGFSSAFNLWSIISILAWVTVVILFWLLPIPALLAQYSILLRLGAGEAPAMLADINQTIIRHATPYDTLRNRSMSPPGEGRRDYLELRRGVFSGIVSCFPHGQDLYVGWTFWIYLSPLRLMFMFIGRKIQNRTGRGNDMYQTLRYDSTRATIAAIHSSVVEVAEKAASGTGPPPEAREVSTGSFQGPAAPAQAWARPDQVRERSRADSDKERDTER
jgi:TM2 domain-containing membrane protein YozV